MRVAMDLAQLELVLGLFCRGDVSSLGQPYKMLRALRSLVTYTLGILCLLECVMFTRPYSTVYEGGDIDGFGTKLTIYQIFQTFPFNSFQ